MKRGALLVLAGTVLALAVSVSAHAQDASVRAHVPFGFSVNESAFPAGDYTLSELSQNSWVVRSNSGDQAITATARPDGTNPEPNVAKLIFTKYGEHYSLSKVWCEGLTTAMAQPKAERAIEIQMTSKNQKPETVYVLASAR